MCDSESRSTTDSTESSTDGAGREWTIQKATDHRGKPYSVVFGDDTDLVEVVPRERTRVLEEALRRMTGRHEVAKRALHRINGGGSPAWMRQAAADAINEMAELDRASLAAVAVEDEGTTQPDEPAS